MWKLAEGVGAPHRELLGMPTMSPDSIEAARLLLMLPPPVREPIVEALRALATWTGSRAEAAYDT
jgi:hypothetical protein